MAGGIVGIISYGCSDLFLTGAPQITFFKVVYRRYTNFSIESIQVDFDDTLNFGKETEIIIPRMGDCISKIYLEINLPAISLTTGDSGNLSPVSLVKPSLNTDLQNYNQILAFMSINAGAYRQAISDYNTENVTPLAMLTNLYNYFTSTIAGSEYSGYESLVNYLQGQSIANSLDTTNAPVINNMTDFINYLHSVNVSEMSNNIKQTGSFTPLFCGITNSGCSYSSIKDVANYYNTITDYTKDDLLQAINTSLSITQQITTYYFNLYNNSYQEQVIKSQNATYQTLQFAWVKRLGHAIIDYVDIYIGGEKIDRHYGQYMDLWYELTHNVYLDSTYSSMIGDVQILTSFDANAKPAYKLVVPIQFWFTKKAGLSLPVIAMEYSAVTLKIKLNDLQKCAYLQQLEESDMSLLNIWENKGYILNCDMLIDYIYLDALERKKFAQAAHEYLIEIVESIELTDISKPTFRLKLDLNHPSKEIIWVFQKQAYTNINDGVNITFPNLYSLNIDGSGDIMQSCQIDFMGQTRVDSTMGTSTFFNYLQPYARHTSTPSRGINVYAFGLNPEEHQPSATCNFSRIANVTMTFQLNPNAFFYNTIDTNPSILPDTSQQLATMLNFSLYNRKYNILRIIGGFGGLAFT